jgi:hypothetical protein
VNGDGVVNNSDRTTTGQTVAGMGYNGFISSSTILTGGMAGAQAYFSETKDLGSGCTGVCNNLNNQAQAVNEARGAWQEIRK